MGTTLFRIYYNYVIIVIIFINRHGKFESVGSLFLALTLIATGLSVGVWSYDKMIAVLAKPKSILTTATVAASAAHNHGLFGHVHNHLQLPSWPALALATISIVSKEWLFHITKRVGESLNSQILIANAWYDISYKLSRYCYTELKLPPFTFNFAFACFPSSNSAQTFSSCTGTIGPIPSRPSYHLSRLHWRCTSPAY